MTRLWNELSILPVWRKGIGQVKVKYLQFPREGSACKRSHDLVNNIDYSSEVVHNPPLALEVCLCDHPLFSMPEQTMQACTTVSMSSAEQSGSDAWDTHIAYFPNSAMWQSCGWCPLVETGDSLAYRVSCRIEKSWAPHKRTCLLEVVAYRYNTYICIRRCFYLSFTRRGVMNSYYYFIYYYVKSLWQVTSFMPQLRFYHT